MYSIIDLETTGFAPSRGDRILELGIAKVEEDLVIDTYSTLINPERDISNYHIHGVEPDLVKNAPKFQEVKDYIKSFINGTTLVAHNASFDFRFLENELIDQEYKLNGICTIKLSRMVDSTLPSRKLDVLCEYYDIQTENSHQALADAIATSKLFSVLKNEFFNLHGEDSFRKQFVAPISFDHTDRSTLDGIEYRRKVALKDSQKEKRKLQNFIKRLPTESLSDNENSRLYLDTLNEVLSDRIISNSELKELKELVTEFSLTQEEVLELHKQYLSEVIKIYLLDGIISEFERNDLLELTQLLGLKIEDLEKLISIIKEKTISSTRKYDLQNIIDGKSICFTGKLQAKIENSEVDRSTAQSIAQQHGMIIKKNVSKKLDYLVVANPNTMSGKAKKAREYEIEILAEPEFWRLIGVNVE